MHPAPDRSRAEKQKSVGFKLNASPSAAEFAGTEKGRNPNESGWQQECERGDDERTARRSDEREDRARKRKCSRERNAIDEE
jgi:hypothetical protein